MEINQSSLVADEFIRRLNFPLDATVVHVTGNDRGSMAFETIMILCLWLHAQMDALPLNWTFLMQRTLASCYSFCGMADRLSIASKELSSVFVCF